MSIHKLADGLYKVRWREGGRNKAQTVHGSRQLAEKIERKKMSLRDENRHLDIKREVNFRMSTLIDRYWQEYGRKKKSQSREKPVLDGIREEMGDLFVREASGDVMRKWYAGLTEVKELSQGTALRHFNVMHHMMEKAATVWSTDTGIDRNPADAVDVVRPDDQRDRYLSAEEIYKLKLALDEKMYRKGSKEVNQTFYRLRLIVLLALTTGMRVSEVFGLKWGDLLFSEELIAVGAKLKGGKFRYVPLTPELAAELKRYPAVMGEDRIFPPEKGATSERQRVDKSFDTALERAGIKDFRFHDLRHTFASWYMMNGGDLYELAKILGHSNIKMTERYAKLAKSHIAKTGNTARGMWGLMAGEKREQAVGA